tara:strand:+ start:7043 stop:7270 length:228 start_codon:yes stop_codon:yes gene_type:complete
MTNREVSLFYMEACERIHNATSMLYENLHESEEEGVTTEIQDVIEAIKQFRIWANTELDLIKEISKEYEEGKQPF